MPIFSEYKEISDDRRDEMIEFIVSKIEKVGLFVPAAFLLETGQPLSFLFSQLVYAGAPFGEVLFQNGQHKMEDYAQVFEDRKNLNILIDRIHERAKEVEIEEAKEKIRKKRLKEKMKEEQQTSEEQNGKKKRFKLPWSR